LCNQIPISQQQQAQKARKQTTKGEQKYNQQDEESATHEHGSAE